MQYKVLHIGKYYPPFMGGIENFMQILLPQQHKQGCQVKAIVHQHQPPSPLFKASLQTEVIDGIEIIRVPTYGKLLFAPVSPLFGYYLKQVLESFKPDVLHIHMPNTSAFWLLISRIAKKIPWVIHWHSDVVVSQHDKLLALAYPFYRPFEAALLKKSKAIIATSPDYLQSSSTLANYTNKAHVIPLALAKSPEAIVNTDQQQRVVEQFWGETATRLLSIGRLTYYKGYQDLIRAMASIDNAKLVIIGGGDQEKQLQKLITQLDLQEQVHLAGKVDTDILNILLKSCDIFCLSSIERTEAFGLVLLEAMSYAKPIVITKVAGSGMNWVTQNNHTALFAEKQNPEDLANKINILQQDPILASQLGENGLTRLLAEFNIDKITQQTNKLYMDLSP